jgi:hypothetical protein
MSSNNIHSSIRAVTPAFGASATTPAVLASLQCAAKTDISAKEQKTALLNPWRNRPTAPTSMPAISTTTQRDFNRSIYCCAAELPVDIPLGIELLKVCPEVFGLFFVLDAGKYLFGLGNFCLWIFDVFFKSLLISDNFRIFVRIGVGNAPGAAAVKSVEFGTDTVSSARADFVADSAFLKGDRTVVDVLRQRQVSRGD